MNQNRRFTRSAISGFSGSKQQDGKNKDELQLRSKVNEAIAGKQFDKALALLKSASPKSHWISCSRAHVLFEQGSLARALNAVRNFIKTERNGCERCFQLLLNIIDHSRPEINKFNNDIQACLSYEKLPNKLRSKFQLLRSQLVTVEDMPQATTRQFQQLATYYQNKGLIFKKVEIVELSSQYRVARAKSTIKPHEIIIFVPQKQMITLEMAKTLPQVNKLASQQSRLKSPKHCMLSIFLLIHMNKGHESPYFNYIQCLPKKLQNFPIYYSEQLLNQLQGTYFLSILKRKKSDISQDFEQILSIVPQLKGQITYDKFVWSRMIVSSRIFGVLINNKKTDALVPIADMLNHKTPKLTSWYFSDQKRGFVVQNANQQIPKGQQIFDSYGSKCNSRFLLNYGFTMPQNSFNQVMIILKKHKNSKMMPPSIKLSTCLNSDQFKIILAYYRQIFYEISSTQSLDRDQLRAKASSFISNDNECDVWRMIQQTMKEQLQEYKTTIKKDEKTLRTCNQQSFNYRNCVEIRLGEKRILQFYINMAKKMIEHFSRKRKVTDISQYEAYIRDILNPGSSTSE